MAGPHLVASAPTFPASGPPSLPSLSACVPAPRRTTLRAVTSTRTRRNHGVFLLGDELLTVDSSRRSAESRVCVTLGNGPVVLSRDLTPTQARAMARALVAASIAAETRRA